MIYLLKLIIDGMCGILDAIGGYCWHDSRRFIMPVLIGLSVAFFTHTWWCFFLPLPAMGTLCIGYSGWGNFGRALWLGLQAVMLGLGLFLLNHIVWFFYVPYVIGACVLGGLYKNWQQLLGDFITGSWLGLVVFLVHP